jgi:hypothetical protein
LLTENNYLIIPMLKAKNCRMLLLHHLSYLGQKIIT